jgi:1-acyl-sn-glycerol-3-phosphate acyltransferase
VAARFNATRYTVFDTPIVKTLFREASLILLRTLGWRRVGCLPTLPKYVLIGAHHTSWWDAIFALAIAFTFRLKLFWMVKHTVFRWPFRAVLGWLGGVPINRASRQDVVSQVVHEFQANETLVLGILPEGTRRKVDYWKSGFYHIAMGAGVPVLLAFLDYPSKTGGFGPLISLTGDEALDMTRIAEFYSTKTGKHPELTGPVRLSSQSGRSQ